MTEEFHIQWHITNQCQLRCAHCYQEDFSRKDDLEGSGLTRIVQNIAETMKSWNGKTCINLTGGEPFLRPELFPLLERLDQESTVEELGIITNGLLLDQEFVRRLGAFSKLKKIKISLDGADAETNDGIRRQGTFEKVIRNLSHFDVERRFEIIFMFTLMKRNYRSLSSLIHLCQELDVNGLILERFIPWGRGREMLAEVLGREEWREVVKTVLEDEAFYPHQAFQIIFREDETEILGAPCVIGRDGLCIMPEGTVFPCRRFPIPIGNLLDDSLARIWERSELLNQLRRKENLKGRCKDCGIKDCRGCRSLALSLTGDYLGEDPHCCLPPMLSETRTKSILP
jgi:radical SAM protein with 4Fe4S-binding SPASM domain